MADTGGVAHFAEGFGLDLADALAGDAELAADFLEGAAVAVDEAEALFQDLAFTLWCARFVAAHPELRCQVTAARNVQNAARIAARSRPPGLRRAFMAKVLLGEPALADLRWCIAPPLAVPTELSDRLAAYAFSVLGGDDPERQDPERHAYRGLPIRAAAIIRSTWAALSANGFSHSTCLPAETNMSVSTSCRE